MFKLPFVVAASCAAIIALSSSAFAEQRIMSGFACFHDKRAGYSDKVGTVSVQPPGGSYATGVTNNDYAGDALLLCPVPDDGLLRKADLTYMRVDGNEYHPSENAWAAACVTAWDGYGGGCGSKAYSSGTGKFHLVPNRSKWTSSTSIDYGYVIVSLPDNDTPYYYQASQLYGLLFQKLIILPPW